MPSLLLPRSRFLHVPKTGGNWVSAVLQDLFPHAQRMAKKHATRRTAPGAERFTFAFVRHPLTWYQSYFAYKQCRGWHPKNDWDLRVQADLFEDFVRRALDETPGHYSQRVRWFVGRPGEEIDFVGRFERLRSDLIRALELAGEEFDRQRILSAPAVNTSDYRRYPAEYSAELARQVLEVEREVIERFYADSEESVGREAVTVTSDLG
jgi:hypothetical protein